jgi:hypothetical protein
VIWTVIPHCLMQCLWCERNARTFKGCEKVVPDIKLSFLQSLFECMTAFGSFSFTNMFEMLDCCSFCAQCWFTLSTLLVYMGYSIYILFNERFTYIKKY